MASAAAVANKASAAVRAAEAAIQSIGLGYDVAEDLRLKYCKRSSPGSSLIAFDDGHVQTIVMPGGISIPNVPKSIKCDKGERMRFRSDVLNFSQMSEQFNQEINISGKVPLGHFNSAFEYSGCWQQDAANTKTLAFDGVGITLYNIALEKSQLVLRDHVKQAVPSAWDPAALSRFIEKFGTHIIVGIKIGGKDMIYAKQQHSSVMVSDEVQKNLKEMADKMFIGGNEQFSRNSDKLETMKHGVTFMDSNPSSSYLRSEIQEVTYLCKRKGGSTVKTMSHNDWCLTVQSHPDVISMSFVPITSLLSGLQGSGFLSHAINLYLRYKPRIEELHQFLDFQLPRQWAPVFGELALGPQKKKQSGASLQFSFMGPKLYVNTTIVDVGKRPVTGLRLYLEGKRSNCIAIHLQHLSSLPSSFQLKDEPHKKSIPSSFERKYYEKVQWKSFSHICTAPVESDDDLSVVTGAHFEVGDSGFKKVLFLRLRFAKVIGATAVKAPEWDGSPGIPQKSGLISTIISTRFTTGQKPPPRPSDVNVNSAIYPGGPPMPAQMGKLLKFVDTTEMTRGPQNTPGYWAVSGARLVVEKGKISLRVKYSLLTVILPDDDEISMEF